MKTTALLSLTTLCIIPAHGAVTIDGARDTDYGSPLAVQQVDTQFGDNASELNAAYARVEGGRLNVLLTGNLETNFNKYDIFIDSRAGGENVLAATPDYDFNNGGIWNSSNLGGLTFDAGFTADFHIFVSPGGGNAELTFVDRLGGTSTIINGNSGTASLVGNIATGGVVATGDLAMNAGAASLTESINYAFDNTNTAGVSGGTGAADQSAATAVATGFEFSVSLADLGAPASLLAITALVNNANHDFASNQFLGGLPAGTANLGGDVNLANIDGDQFFTVAVPEPSTGFLALLGAGLFLRRRR